MKQKFSILPAELAYSPSDRLSVMNFLNEVAESYPGAVSFGSGRPSEAFFNVRDYLEKIPLFANYLAREQGMTTDAAYRMLGQYGKTCGIINPLIAECLAQDENIQVSPSSILVTYGAQEGMELCLSALFRQDRDVLLVADPTYIGITGLAAIKNIEVEEVRSDEAGPNLEHLLSVMRSLHASGKRPGALYLIPDFNNPMGSSISLKRRRELLDFCVEHRLIVIEDNPYGLFRYEGEPLPTLKALDQHGIVIYLGTFAKSLCPGLRLGYLISEQTVADEGLRPLIGELSKVKSLVSVNTGQVHQAIVGGLLLESGNSLRKRVEPLIELYKSNRDCMLNALAETFHSEHFSECDVTWNRPEGGFFLVLTLPFKFGAAEIQECAERFGVICMPLSFFSAQPEFSHSIRLSFSYVDHEQIAKGVKALGDYILELQTREKDSNRSLPVAGGC